MTSPFRYCIVLSSAITATVLFCSSSFAQTRAISFDRFRPVPAGDSFFATESAYVDKTKLSASAAFAYSHRPLALHGPNETIDLLRYQTIAHLGLSVDLASRLKLLAGIPLAVFQDGSEAYGRSPGIDFQKASTSGVGSPYVGARLQLLAQSGNWPSAALSFRVQVPKNDSASYVSESSPRYEPAFVLGARYPHYLWGVSIWQSRRNESSSIAGLSGSEMGFSAALNAKYGRLQFGPEFYGTTVADSKTSAFARSTSSSEILLGAKLVGDDLTAGLAASAGLNQGVGTPNFRLIFAVTYSWSPQDRDENASMRTSANHNGSVSSKPDRTKSISSPSAAQDKDTDNDGLVDSQDACPKLYASEYEPGEPGCPKDRDKDGIADNQDACPNNKGIRQAEPSQNGCPPDADKDGIVDTQDACPTEKGIANQDPKENGCSLSVRIQGPQIVIIQQIRFERGKDRILEESFPTLQGVADTMSEHPDITRLAVDGHTDDAGTPAQNLQLSQRRAVSVVRWLIAHGVDARRLESRSFGARRPLAQNKSEQGRSQNRRVEFQIRKRNPEGERAWIEGE